MKSLFEQANAHATLGNFNVRLGLSVWHENPTADIVAQAFHME